METIQPIEASKYLPKAIENVYDLASLGLGMISHAVKLIHRGEILPDWARSALQTHGSNYTYKPYVLGWLKADVKATKYFPFNPSPSIELHKKLLLQTEAEYDALSCQAIRTALDRNHTISVDDPSKPISDEELPRYLMAAKDNRLVLLPRRFFNQRVNIGPVSYEPDLTRKLPKLGINFSANFYGLNRQLLFLPEFRPQLLRAAVHKLGGMLAVTEQILYDAKYSGVPISASFKPSDVYDAHSTRRKNWKEMFGEEVPAIAELYQSAFKVFSSVADRTDPLVAYLFDLDVTQYFSK